MMREGAAPMWAARARAVAGMCRRAQQGWGKMMRISSPGPLMLRDPPAPMATHMVSLGCSS
eukprot:5313836-Heterocapsa_arctica.AAC.1